MDWKGLNWKGLDWKGLDWKVERIGLEDWHGKYRVEKDWIGKDLNGKE